MTAPPDIAPALEPSYRLDQLVAVSGERALYRAWDRLLKRHVSLRVHLMPEAPGRAWFLRETETLAALDHPAIRHVYAAGLVGSYAYRTANWIEGESLADALRRGPRPVPTVLGLVRDLLSAAEHAHARGVIMRRITPATLMLDLSGRGIITDLRHASWCLAYEQADDLDATAYAAPEIRGGGPGEPTSDVYTIGAILYHALTGQAPAALPPEIVPPRELRAAIPAAMERVLVRALHADPRDRFLTATEMLEDFVADAGTFQAPLAPPQLGESGFEPRLRRALGDDYELLEELGSGGFGRVYRVRDLALEREVAMKVLHPSLTADLGVIERFRREAQLAGRLHHANIVGIYDIMGRAGLQWYTMELVPGQSLAQRVQKDGPLPLERVIQLLHQALSALEYAHGLGLVHRDIKPENMLLDTDGRLRITDFGLALALRGEARFGGATSRSGTPQFAAPEQLLGERVDHRADLYSLAAVTYFMLLGKPPFAGSTPEAVLAQQTTEHLPALREQRTDVSDDLEKTLARALASDPARRYPSARAFHDAVDDVTGGVVRRLWGLVRGL